MGCLFVELQEPFLPRGGGNASGGRSRGWRCRAVPAVIGLGGVPYLSPLIQKG